MNWNLKTTSQMTQPTGISDRVKRMLDVGFGVCGLLVVVPVLAICAVMIKLADPGPIFYAQWRVGRDGQLFRIFKLRTMYLNAENRSGAVFAQSGDSRVIGLCRWMRNTHVDELPQLWNILRGDMTLVGPRPERPELFKRITEAIPDFEQRLVVRPGLTGLAQISSGYADDFEGLQRKLDFDLKYIRNSDPWKDLKLIAVTMPKIFGDRTAH